MQSNRISNLPIERHYEIQFKLIHCIIIHTNHSQFTNAKSKTYNRFFFSKTNDILQCPPFIKHLNC